MTESSGVDVIAIVGMAGRFPGAPDVDSLWSNLCDGIESVGPYTSDQLRVAGAPTQDPAFVNAGASMDGIEAFDARFFGMSRREAELTDPQHRVVLETAWATLEQAGYEPGVATGRVGIFGGVAVNLYYRHNLRSHPELLTRVGDVPLLLATEREYAITRTAYKLGLQGPAVSVNTACSTSAVAIHLAAQSLLAGETDIALAGGAYIRLPAQAGYLYQEDGILSSDGHVRPFDADATGTVMSSGVAFVALKRLSDALDDGDTVYAVIRGTAVNNDGAARISFTAPGVAGQADVIAEALAVADVDAGTIGFVEAHGTGTSLGDPIEVSALVDAYRRHTDRRQYCAIGSLKANVGHLDAAAGVTGVIKAALALYHGRIPPSINYQRPNPHIDFESSPFFVNTAAIPWDRGHQPRRAGVSSFGFGGTNAHIVLEEAPDVARSEARRSDKPWIIPLSAKTGEALAQRKELLAEHLVRQPEPELEHVAHTLALGRSRMPFRSAIVAADVSSAIRALRQPEPSTSVTRSTPATGTQVAFLFTGQGAQYPGMGAGLYGTEPVFAAAIQDCARTLGAITGDDLVDLLYGEHADPTAASERLLQTGVGQPAIFALQYALAQLWASWGIQPVAMVGHSVGEVAAACVGGLFTLEDAMRLAAIRGQLMQALPIGAMTAVMADEATVLPSLDPQTSLAAVNAPGQCVASGPPFAIAALEGRLAERDIAFRRLATDRAFHSAMMEPALDRLRSCVEGLAPSDLRIPMISTLTGDWTTTQAIGTRGVLGSPREADGPVLGCGHPAPGRPTRCRPARDRPWRDPDIAGPTAGGDVAGQRRDLLAASRLEGRRHHPCPPLARGRLGRRRRRGLGRHQRGTWPPIPLPTYPFARERFWVERSGDPEHSDGAVAAVDARGRDACDGTGRHPGRRRPWGERDRAGGEDRPSGPDRPGYRIHHRGHEWARCRRARSRGDIHRAGVRLTVPDPGQRPVAPSVRRPGHPRTAAG